MSELRNLLTVKERQTGSRGLVEWVSYVQPIRPVDPLGFFHRASKQQGFAVYWCSSDRSFSLVGAGVMKEFEGEGEGRLLTVSSSWQQWLSHLTVLGDTGFPGTGPLLLGGISFDPHLPQSGIWEGYHDTGFFLPKFLLTTCIDRVWLTVNMPIPAIEERDDFISCSCEDMQFLLRETEWQQARPYLSTAEAYRPMMQEVRLENWMEAVKKSIHFIQAGKLKKVVLAREVYLQYSNSISPVKVLDSLRQTQKDCYLFAIQRGESCFLGATPERLVKVEHPDVETTCLAGSAPRGSFPEEDQKLGQRLFTRFKEREEHDIVKHMLQNTLSEVCRDIRLPMEPLLMKLRDIQHLYTPIQGQLLPGCDIFSLLSLLHPTPAVGGYPKKEAMQTIRELERLDRGWYASPVGWLDAEGRGEFVVGIRSGLLRGDKAFLFAGCGITSASNPEAEYAESRMKLQPMLSALEGSVTG